jgi:hypothetical protein
MLLFDHSEKLDRQLFKALCEAIPDLFPNIVYDGTEVAGASRLLDAAKAWTNHIHKRELISSGLAAGLRRLASALVRPRCRRSHLQPTPVRGDAAKHCTKELAGC